MIVGPRSSEQLARLARVWNQGEHLLISGGTGSGKTALGRYVDQIRINKGGHVVVFVCKPGIDETIVNDYKGWTRWTQWKRRPSPHENRVLFWPKTEKAKSWKHALEIQKNEFGPALDSLFKGGKWTVDFDEGYYMCDPSFLGFADEIKGLHALGRSSKLTLITKMQRPSHVPLILYGSASHALLGRTREQVDVKRLSELGGRTGAKELATRIDRQGRHDFLWVPVAPDWEPETINLRS